MHRQTAQRGTGSKSVEVSNAVVGILREFTGRGPTKCRTAIDRDFVAVFLAETMTKFEQTLVASDKSEEMLHLRKELQDLMRNDLVTAVEMIMERKVIAFMGDSEIDPDMMVQVFMLEPPPESGRERDAFSVPLRGEAHPGS